MKLREHGSAMAAIALFLAIAFGAAGIAFFSTGGSSAPTDVGAGNPPGTENPYDCPQAEPVGFALSDVVGKPLPEVEQWADAQDWTVRAIVIDGQPMAATMDYNPDRLNVQTEDDVVTRYCGNG
jgi:hypothetical protein